MPGDERVVVADCARWLPRAMAVERTVLFQYQSR